MPKESFAKCLIFTFILLLAFSLTITATKIPILENLENKIHDFSFILRNRISPQPVPEDIIIVAIDEASFQELGRPWPWPRHLHARLIDNLNEAGAKVICLDIVFADPSDVEDDRILTESIKKAGNVIIASSLDITEDRFILKKSLVEPLDNFKSASLGIGMANLIPDSDNFIRRTPLEIEGISIFAFSAAKSYSYNNLNIKDPEEPLIINYLGPPGSFRVVSYYQALDYKNFLPKDIFKNKIVLIGLYLETTPYTTTKSLDSFATPFFSVSGSRMFGIEVHANIINTLFRDIQIKELGFTQIILTLIILLILSGSVILPLRPLNGSITAALIIISYITIALFLFIFKRIQISVLYPSLQTAFIYIGAILYNYEIAEKISIYDPLTSLLNRRNLEVRLEKSIHHAIRHHEPLSLVMADIDHFKSINDTYGHQAGDYVLIRLAQSLKKNLKHSDIIARYGGEEFCIIMPKTELSDAERIIDTLRENIANTKMEMGPGSVTMSFGITGLLKEDTGKSIIKRADEALYKAKDKGRNCVVITQILTTQTA